MTSTKKQFVQIIQSHQGILNSICRIYFHSDEDKKDARQEIILQLWKAYPNFRGEAKVSTWLYKVALNTVLNIIKKSGKEPQKIDFKTIAELPGVVSSDDDKQQLQQLISFLNNEDKALVILILEGYRHQEIATTLNMSISNVSTRLNRIKKKLKRLYKQQSHGTT